MMVFHGFEEFRALPRPAAVAIGNFDGVHLGHRRILARLCALADARDFSSLVLTFDPHPERVLGKKAVRMIDSPEQRLERLRKSCVEAVLVTRFDRAFSELSGPHFVERILLERLGAREVVVGRDFHFGRGRRGDVGRLRELGRQHGLRVHVVPPAVIDGVAVSSSAIRRLLIQGRVNEAARLLGRPYEISGEVVRGLSRGRRLGAPTANLRTANEILPDGIFITEAIWRGRTLPSVTSIGTNPTFGLHPTSVETHILDRRVRLYGARLTVRFLQRIRETRKFPDAQTLAARIGRDLDVARAFFAGPG
ncbi:MAG: bifunctional riboflavin kinase/FAD synthetase [Candidatus Aminicenantales bacterium]|jgi:riboflavin kinase/FMN adenylyltransferase